MTSIDEILANGDYDPLFARALPYLAPLFPSVKDQERLAAAVRKCEAFLDEAEGRGFDRELARKLLLTCRHEADPVAAARVVLCL